MRIKVQTLRMFLWLGNLAVIALIALLLVKIALGNRGEKRLFAWMPKGRIEDATKVEPTITGGGKAFGLSWDELSSVYSLNVTGKEPPKPIAEVKPEIAVPKMKKLDEVIQVVAVYAYSDPKDPSARAQIRYLEDGPSDAAAISRTPSPPTPTQRSMVKVQADDMKVGDKLRSPYDAPPFEGEVLAIEIDGILFRWGGEEVVVSPPLMAKVEDDTKRMPGLNEEMDPSAEAALALARRETKQLGADSWLIGTDEQERVAEEHEKLMREVDWTQYYLEEDKRLRLKIAKLPEDSLAYERGLREGDILRRINGEEISSQESLVQYVKHNSDVSAFKVELVRKGSPVTKIFQLAK